MPAKTLHKGEILGFRVADNNIVVVMRKAFVISRFAAKDFPLPGVPKISPLGFLSCFAVSRVCMLLAKSVQPIVKGCAPLKSSCVINGIKIAVLLVVSPL